MPKRKKKAFEMTDEELKRRIFPKPVREELERIAHQNDGEPEPKLEENDSSHR
ncbi:hypothetical protein ACFLX9_02500 [Chloroflexota bacterium]